MVVYIIARVAILDSAIQNKNFKKRILVQSNGHINPFFSSQ